MQKRAPEGQFIMFYLPREHFHCVFFKIWGHHGGQLIDTGKLADFPQLIFSIMLSLANFLLVVASS